MPIIEEISDYENENSLQDVLNDARTTLKIPQQFQDVDWAVSEHGRRLISWRNSTNSILHGILREVEQEDSSVLQDASLYAMIIELVIPFTQSNPWMKSETKITAEKIVSSLPTPSQDHIRHILVYTIKPLFDKATFNPHLHPETARKTNISLKGDEMHFPNDENAWKKEPGVKDILFWCLSSFQESDWEMLWPLIIPPLLTILDDWEALHRLSGIALVRKFISVVPVVLLVRTGIDQLIQKSLETSLLRYGDSLSPALFRQAGLAWLDLTVKVTKADSMERYDMLFVLLGENVIAGAWSLGYREPLLIQASYSLLSDILEMLGTACVRYLKAMVPQLLHTLNPIYEGKHTRTMQLSSLKALRSVIRAAKSRIPYWIDEIVAGIAKCWTQLHDSGDGHEDVKTLLLAVVSDLSEVCPEEMKLLVTKLTDLDLDCFSPFLDPRVAIV